MTHPSIPVQIAPTAVPSTPSWLGEVAVLAHVFNQFGLHKAIEERVRFARARMGDYEGIDFVVMLIGYAVSGERPLQAFSERLLPFAEPFMALFGRANLPHPATLSRALSVLDQAPVEALRTLFQKDLVARSTLASPPAGVWDRQGQHWSVVDVDGTKQAARQRALPQTPALPAPHRRFDQVCAAAYLGRKPGEVARTRTTLCQAHTHQWLGTFGSAGNGDSRGEFRRARAVIESYASALSLPLSPVLTRLDGMSGNAAPLADLLASGGPGVIVRGTDYHLLDRPAVSARLHLPPDQETRHASRQEPVARSTSAPILHSRPQDPWCACWWLHVRSPTLPLPSAPCATGRSMNSSSPPSRQTPSHLLMCLISPCIAVPLKACEPLKIRNKTPIAGCLIRASGQEFWQIIAQWIWNLR